MTYLITSFLIIEKIKAYLISDYPKLEINENALMWGVFADDFIYFQKDKDNQIKTQYDFDSKKHEITDFICNYANNRNNPFFLSYAIGFLTHYALYKSSDEYLNFKINELMEKTNSDDYKLAKINVIRALDTIILRAQQNKIPDEINFKKLLSKNDEILDNISTMYSKLFSEVFLTTVLEKEIKKALLNFLNRIKGLNDPTGIKKYFTYKKEKFLNKPHYNSSMYYTMLEDDDIDYANSDENEWSDSNDLIQTKSFFNIFDDAVIYSKKLIYTLISGNKVSMFIDTV